MALAHTSTRIVESVGSSGMFDWGRTVVGGSGRRLGTITAGADGGGA
jgi:hypothetical protein